jgi:hypothetical protein
MSNERLEEKIDKVVEDIGEIKTILARNTSSLEYHIHRTDLLEDNVSMLRKELKPVEDHVKMVRWSFYLLGTIGAILLALKQLGIFDNLF